MYFARPSESSAEQYVWKANSTGIDPDFADGPQDGFEYKYFVYFRISLTPLVIDGPFDHGTPVKFVSDTTQ